MSFSQRYGFKPVKNTVQLESIDDDLRVGLWNVLTEVYWNPLTDKNPTLDVPVSNNSLWPLLVAMWRDYFKLPLDLLDHWWGKTYEHLRKYFYSCEWHEVYSFIEFVAEHSEVSRKRSFIDQCNAVLKRDLSGYRFIGQLLVPITAEEQLVAVEDALRRAASKSPVRVHLETALKHLSNRKDPDYRNSIKESISAVESLCRLIASSQKATLGQALGVIEKKVTLHPALKSGFSSIYGYTSDADGIRHALLEESTLDFEDALFMLVSCSGFVSYLLQKAAKAGIKLS